MKICLASALLSFGLLTASIPSHATGEIAGSIQYSGKQGKLKKIPMSADPQCEKLHVGEDVYQEAIAINENGTLANVFVHITKGVADGLVPESVPAPFIDQTGCLYLPRVQGAVVGQVLLIRNNDPTLHNLHAWSMTRNSFNVAQPTRGLEDEFELRDEEVMLKIKCDVHPWMLGWVGVVPHGFFAVSDTEGNFQINDLPPGKYVVQAWQETFGTVTKEVEVRDGKTTALNFEFAGRRRASKDGVEIQELELSEYAAEIRLVIAQDSASAASTSR